jgi:hypothetical protein
MKINEIQAMLLAAARALPPDEHVPYCFERRVMALLGAEPAPDPWALWSRLLWRAAAPCVAIMVALGVWTVVAVPSNNSAGTFAADFDRTIWGPLTSINDSW